jgi:hypothetical protein
MIRLNIVYTFGQNRRREYADMKTLASAVSFLDKLFFDQDQVDTTKPVWIKFDMKCGTFHLDRVLYIPSFLSRVIIIFSGKDYYSTRLRISSHSPSCIRATTPLGKTFKRSLQKIEITFQNLNVGGNGTIDFDFVPDSLIFKDSQIDVRFENVLFSSETDLFFAGCSPAHNVYGKNCLWEVKRKIRNGSIYCMGSLGMKGIHSTWTQCEIGCGKFDVFGSLKYPTTCTFKSSWVMEAQIQLQSSAKEKDCPALTLWSWSSELFKGLFCSGKAIIIAHDSRLRGDSYIDEFTTLFDTREATIIKQDCIK